MSNYLAIATVTATLQRLLQTAIQIDVAGARVTTVRPDAAGGGTPEVGVNVYLYQASPNLAWRNADLRTRRPKGDLLKQAQAGIDLSYLLTFYGNEVELEPQRLMGITIRTLVDQPILTPEMIRETVSNETFRFLAGSTLADQIERITLVPMNMTTDDLSKIWSVFFQTPYMLSFAYQGSTVLIEGEKAGKSALPVRGRQFYITPNQPVIEQVAPENGLNQPIVSTSSLIIRGRQLQVNTPQLRIGEAKVTPQTVMEAEIKLNLAALTQERQALRAGVQSLQLVSVLPRRSATDPEQFVGSNVVAFVLCPTIATAIVVANLRTDGDGLCSAELLVQCDLSIGIEQQVVLLLNERSTNQPTAYVFAANPRLVATDQVNFSVRNVKTGTYLVRVQVDGAESLLTPDAQPDSPTFDQFISPCVVLS